LLDSLLQEMSKPLVTLCYMAVLTALPSTGARVLRKRDACTQAQTQMDSCLARAFKAYQAAFRAGDDGRPDWIARKSCNYLSAVDHCSNLLIGECHTVQEVNAMKDVQLKGVLEQIEKQISSWDTDKCPTTRDYMKRLNAGEDDTEEVSEAEEEKVCSPEEFRACTQEAYKVYKAALTAGPDGRPDWMARKACNYMTTAVDECGNLLIGTCNTEEEVVVMKDSQYQGILNQLAEQVKEWDSDKCPVIQAYVERQSLAYLRHEVQGDGRSEIMPMLWLITATWIDILSLFTQ